MSLITWLILIILVLNTFWGNLHGSTRGPRYLNDLGVVASAYFLPIVGFVFLFVAGRGLSTKKLQRIQHEYESGVKHLSHYKSTKTPGISYCHRLITRQRPRL